MSGCSLSVYAEGCIVITHMNHMKARNTCICMHIVHPLDLPSPPYMYSIERCDASRAAEKG